MDDQIQQAVEIACNPSANNELKQEALQFIKEVKTSNDGWESCLSLLHKNQSISEQTKFFIFQVLDEKIEDLNNDQLLHLKNCLFQYVNDLILNKVIQAVYIRNAIAKTMALLFCRIYVNIYPNYLKDLLSLIKNNNGNGGYNEMATDLYMRVLLVIHSEIGDNLIQRKRVNIEYNNTVKDAIRSNDVTNLTSSWKDILSYFSQQEPSDFINEILNNTVQSIGDYISWVEINLILDNDYLNLIFQFLGNSRPSNQRIVTSNTFMEIIKKKMPVLKKLNLMTVLNLTSVISNLNLSQSSQDLEFMESISKLVNAIGVELILILENATQEELANNEFRNLTMQQILQVFPLVFQFLRHEYDDVAVHVFPFIGAYLLFLKQNIVNENIDFSPLNNEEILTSLLNNIILKMKYDEEDDGSDDEDVEAFQEVRNKLKSFQESVMVLNENLGLSVLTNCINESLFGESKEWRKLELGLFELTNYSEILKNNIMNLPKTMVNASRPYYIFNEMLCKVVENAPKILVHHPLIQLLFFELILKHYNFFVNSNIVVEGIDKQVLVLKVLKIFISEFGVFNSNSKVKLRSWFIFYRFIKMTKPKVEDYILEELINNLLPLLDIKFSTQVAINPKNPTEIELENLEDHSNFESQLYLFESVGLLISFVDNSKAEFQVKLMEVILQPLFLNLENCINNVRQSKSNLLVPIQTHHLLMAIGTFIKGFENCFNANEIINEKFLNHLEQISTVVIITLENFIDFNIIRNATRFTLVRVFLILSKNVSLTNNLLEFILNKYLSLLLVNFDLLKISELIEFLNFIGQISHFLNKFQNFYGLLNNLITPLITKTSAIIDDKSIESDDFVKKEKENLLITLISLLISISNNNLTSLLLTPENGPIFGTIVNKLLNYSINISEPQVSKLAIAELNNLVVVLGPGYITDPEDINGKNVIVEDINTILINNLIILSFELPFKHTDFDIKNSQHRSLVTEIARILKSISLIGSPKNSDQPNESMINNLQMYMSSLNIQGNVIEDFLKNLMNSNEKEFNKYLINFITQFKG
ncbi:hypothetical protein PACTADRAFT_1281 [Pachysolen tannophilus NRRL Y-2460]|uniref:Exportin-T n=1 Tax=Pachysolen tannophilus NRRL Y-2460 TaxID=669874 RepID=A0A1E4TY72_PACTA|nr:hypothetical protein PACTADRAFT_1281 [Pachysolen tannophilus NRRL Y-2460]